MQTYPSLHEHSAPTTLIFILLKGHVQLFRVASVVVFTYVKIYHFVLFVVKPNIKKKKNFPIVN